MTITTARLPTVLVLAAAGLAIAAPALAQTINVYNWNDYVGETTLDEFTKATGIKVNYDVFDNLEIVEQKLLVGNSGYDVVIPTAEPTVARLIKAGALQKLDKSKIPNLANLDPILMERVAASDPGNQYAAIYQWGTVGLGLVPAKIQALAPDAPLDSFDLLFKPEWAAKIAPCGITILDSAIDTLPSVLNYLGFDPNSENVEELAKAEALLASIRPYIKNFVTGQTINNLAGGDTCVALAYSGDVLQAAARAEEAGSGVVVTYVMPKEGVQLWFDMMTIPAGAPNLEGAHAYINYILQPAVIGAISSFTGYANGVPASFDLMPEEVRSNPIVFPSDAAKREMFAVRSLSPAAERLRTRLWTRITTGF